MGQRAPLSLSEVTRIKKMLTKRGDAGLRDLALFSTAIDTMLRAQDLLTLTVKDVRKRDRVMRDPLELTTAKFGEHVQCVLSKTTKKILAKWIELSGKKPGGYLFTGRLGGGLSPMSVRQVSRLVKSWTEDIGLEASLYGMESLRRTRSLYILNKTENMEAVRIMLGLADIRTTARYLSDAKPVNALAINRAHQL
ncbi:MAG: tyrosine-type recombinase/integrase [Gammaproteobacteria bacterium]|nr:tyrosine-type recombinase/integrase [Gammaproteobacteria bacterium]MCZ6855446.1 tyrosine-type recombinase/integrase [Gammaproteobacteria bacterium]